jgi:hypothetical protein
MQTPEALRPNPTHANLSSTDNGRPAVIIVVPTASQRLEGWLKVNAQPTSQEQQSLAEAEKGEPINLEPYFLAKPAQTEGRGPSPLDGLQAVAADSEDVRNVFKSMSPRYARRLEQRLDSLQKGFQAASERRSSVRTEPGTHGPADAISIERNTLTESNTPPEVRGSLHTIFGSLPPDSSLPEALCLSIGTDDDGKVTLQPYIKQAGGHLPGEAVFPRGVEGVETGFEAACDMASADSADSIPASAMIEIASVLGDWSNEISTMASHGPTGSIQTAVGSS